jgi:predicted  nucleic acid-binding Zn-ribbon protein
LSELRTTVQTHENAVTSVENEQSVAREEIAKEKEEIASSLDSARQARNQKTSGVPRPLLGKYDRIRTKRAKALYPLRGDSCGNCDTAIPMQRRNLMTVNGAIDVCEACGVLLYRAE